MIQAQTASLCGSVISGRYQIIESLGQGGMAHVYLALDQKTGGNVAIKVMHDDLSNDQVFIKRFEAEARAASSLNHPNIVRVIGIGQDHDHRYIIQEYVEGSSLKELINAEGAIPWQSAIPMAIQIGLALEHAHKSGLVHRDIKPHNILITKERIAKVTDFGIAQAMTANTITLSSGDSFGSVQYSSPEQARGTIVSERSDIYSMGVMLYEMITGRVPFDGETPVAIAIKHLQEVPPLPSSINRTIPRGLDQIVMKCIQKSPDNRYQSARELVNELDALMIDPSGVFGVVASLPDFDGQTTALQVLRPDPNYNKLREIEQIMGERRRSRHRDTAVIMVIILLALVFVGSIGAWGWRKLSATIQKEPSRAYELENYVGRDLSEVLKILNKDNIMIEVEYSGNSTVIVGLIIAQSPGSGVMIKKTNAKLILTVSGGPDLQVIPDLSGQSSVKAQAELTQTFGYKVTILSENARIDQDKVIRTIPAAGQRAPRGGSIVLVVSNGMPMVTMPNFIGKSFTTARSQILLMNLVPGPLVSISGTVPEASRIVIRQSVPAGSKIMEQSVISLSYGTAQDYANWLNPTPKPAPFISMPGLDRISLASMRTLLTLQGLTNITLGYLSAESQFLPESQLFVIMQTPSAGSQIELTGSVQILVGSMAEYSAFKNPTPTMAPTPMPTPVPPTPTSAPTQTPTTQTPTTQTPTSQSTTTQTPTSQSTTTQTPTTRSTTTQTPTTQTPTTQTPTAQSTSAQGTISADQPA